MRCRIVLACAEGGHDGQIAERVGVSTTVGKWPDPATNLVIVDDIGLLPISADAAEGRYRLIDAAYEHASLAISSNLHPSGFDKLMEPTSPPPS